MHPANTPRLSTSVSSNEMLSAITATEIFLHFILFLLISLYYSLSDYRSKESGCRNSQGLMEPFLLCAMEGGFIHADVLCMEMG